MKNGFLLSLMAMCVTACSVDPLEMDSINNQSLNAGVELIGCAGPDNSKSITLSDAAAIGSWEEVRKLYLSLLPQGVSRNGTFDPTIWDLIDNFQEMGLGDYTTKYTVSTDGCSDSVTLTITVIPDLQEEPPCDIDAGTDSSKTLTYSQAASIESWDEVRRLYLSLLEPGVPRNGVFDPAIWDLINRFQGEPLGSFSTTYTIGEGDCKDSVILTVIVVADEQEEPLCNLNAGPDNSKTISVDEAASIESWDEVRKLYLSLLGSGIPRDGTFSPSIWNLIHMFNDPNRISMLGDYTTTYTITDGDCADSVNLTVTVVANP